MNNVPPILSAILRRNARNGNRVSNIRLVPLSRAAEVYELSQLFAASRPDFEHPNSTRDADPAASDPCADGDDSLVLQQFEIALSLLSNTSD